MEAARNGYTGVALICPLALKRSTVLPNSLRTSTSTTYISGSLLRLSDLFLSRYALLLCTWLLFVFFVNGVRGFGSMATIAVSYDGNGDVFVCGIMQGNGQNIQCWSSKTSVVTLAPSQASFLGIAGGKGFMCAIRADTGRPICWNTSNFTSPRRLRNQAYMDIVAGNSHVCALLARNSTAGSSNGSLVTCWRDQTLVSNTPTQQAFTSLASGGDFVCGIKSSDSTVQCWGVTTVAEQPNATFMSVQAGLSHSCGLTNAFNVQCWGNDTYNQLGVPDGRQFLSLALGEQHSCGIDAFTRTIVCWGDSSSNRTSPPANLSFSTIAAGDSFTCGLLFNNFSTVCWGASFGGGTLLPLNLAIPSSCTNNVCGSGSFQQLGANSSSICSSPQLHVCVPCRIGCQTYFFQTGQCTSQQDITCAALALPPAPSQPSSPSPLTTVVVVTRSRLSKGLIVLIAFGAAGALSELLTVGWCVWAKFWGPVGFSFNGSQGRVHNSSIGSTGPWPVPPPTRVMKRQRSSTSSVRSRGEIPAGRAQAFTIAEMAAATMDFSEENVIAAGSFGIVYRGMLPNGREVAIKKREKETAANEKKMEEKESAFESELEFLSRLHHKHLVSLVGYCDEDDERMLVYDYMPNGTLHDHLHGTGCGGVLPWQMRVKIALEAARGVEYLHTYAMPPIIHRDIKSSNILLDGGWNARVSDFGLSTRGPAENSHLSLMAAGTLGYMDPEYYRLQHLTIKSDVYSFGVVLLELLTGERAIHKQSHGPVNIVDFVVPRIVNGDLASVLDQRPGAPTVNELKALEMVAQLAAQCVRLEGKERPTMTEIVGGLEKAMAYGSISQSESQSMLSVAPFDTVTMPFESLDEDIDTMPVFHEGLEGVDTRGEPASLGTQPINDDDDDDQVGSERGGSLEAVSRDAGSAEPFQGGPAASSHH